MPPVGHTRSLTRTAPCLPFFLPPSLPPSFAHNRKEEWFGIGSWRKERGMYSPSLLPSLLSALLLTLPPSLPPFLLLLFQADRAL